MIDKILRTKIQTTIPRIGWEKRQRERQRNTERVRERERECSCKKDIKKKICKRREKKM